MEGVERYKVVLLEHNDEWDTEYHLFVLRSESQFSLRHIHCYDKREKGFELLVGFRDYLNTHRDAAMQYENLKKSLPEQHRNDRE